MEFGIELLYLSIKKNLLKELKEIRDIPKATKQKIKRIDRIIYFIAIAGPLMLIPQLLRIWFSKDAASIALVTWISFTIFATIWLLYGIYHKEKPIIISNTICIILYLLIILGGFLFGAGWF